MISAPSIILTRNYRWGRRGISMGWRRWIFSWARSVFSLATRSGYELNRGTRIPGL